MNNELVTLQYAILKYRKDVVLPENNEFQETLIVGAIFYIKETNYRKIFFTKNHNDFFNKKVFTGKLTFTMYTEAIEQNWHQSLFNTERNENINLETFTHKYVNNFYFSSIKQRTINSDNVASEIKLFCENIDKVEFSPTKKKPDELKKALRNALTNYTLVTPNEHIRGEFGDTFKVAFSSGNDAYVLLDFSSHGPNFWNHIRSIAYFASNSENVNLYLVYTAPGNDTKHVEQFHQAVKLLEHNKVTCINQANLSQYIFDKYN